MGLKEVLKTQFQYGILNEALEVASEQIGLHQNHMDERFTICSLLLAAGAKAYQHNDNGVRYFIPLLHYSCYYGNSYLLKQVIESVPHTTVSSMLFHDKNKDTHLSCLLFNNAKLNVLTSS